MTVPVSFPTPAAFAARGMPKPPTGFTWKLTADQRVGSDRIRLTLELYRNPGDQWKTDVLVDVGAYAEVIDCAGEAEAEAQIRQILISVARRLLVAQRVHLLAARFVHPNLLNVPQAGPVTKPEPRYVEETDLVAEVRGMEYHDVLIDPLVDVDLLIHGVYEDELADV